MIPFFFLQENDDNTVSVDKRHMFNIGAHLLDDMAMVLGLVDKAIDGTENDPDGRAYPDDVEEYMLGIHKYIVNNLYYIETLIHQMSPIGGLTPGEYECETKSIIWKKKEQNG